MLRVFIESRVEPVTETGCWIWTKSISGTGYGDFRLNGKHMLAHRASYEAYNGPIPDGMHVLHKCDVRCCVNPAHLFLGSNLDNILDSVKKGRRKGITRKRPSGLKYAWDAEKKEKWIASKRKLSDNDLESMRKDRAERGMSYVALGKKYGVNRATVKRYV